MPPRQSPETARPAELHPADVVFEKVGLGAEFGDTPIEDFHGRTDVTARTYFFQSETDPKAQIAFAALYKMPTDDPRFEGLKAGFLAAAERFLIKK